MEKDTSLQTEKEKLEAAAKASKAKGWNRTIKTLLKNALYQLEAQEQDLEETTEKISKIGKKKGK